MGKNKLKKFAEMEVLPNVFQCGIRDAGEENPVVAMHGHWREQVFHNDNPIVLELGCGRGDYSVGLARLYPEKNFIGVDIKGARMWAGAKEAHLTGLANVAFLRTNIESIGSFFGVDEVDEVWITFPDPQMKKATKRLTSTWFMTRYEALVKEGGVVHLKTDSPFLYTYTREMLRINGYEVLADTDDLYKDVSSPTLVCEVSSATLVCEASSATLSEEKGKEQEEIILRDARALKTHYEKQWLDRGLTIKYLSWRLTKKAAKEEPTIEIEKDTYRSYGRNYNTTDTE